MTYRRRHRWLRRFALGLAFATFAAPAAAKPDESGNGVRYVTAGGWSGYVDAETGIPLSAGIPDAESFGRPDGDALAIENALETQATAKAEAIHDPYLTDVFVRPGESLGGPDGTAYSSQSVLGEAVKSRQSPAPEPQVISYLSHGMASDGEVGARPDDKADRFAHSDAASSSELASSGSSVDWDDAVTLGIGAIVLALALGLGFGFVKRPKLAGL